MEKVDEAHHIWIPVHLLYFKKRLEEELNP